MTVKYTGSDIDPYSPRAATTAHTEGNGCVASGNSSHAEGSQSTASAACAHAEGGLGSASGTYSHVEGYQCSASGSQSHAEGYSCTASGQYARASGYSSLAGKHAQLAHGGLAGWMTGLMSPGGGQYSLYSLGCTTTTTAASLTELTFNGSTTITLSGAATNVMVVPVLSVFMITYNIVAKYNVTASATPAGAGWTGSLLAARGNVYATPGAYTMAVNATGSTTGTVVSPTYSTDSTTAGALQLNISMTTTNTTNNYVSFKCVNNPGGVFAVVGSLQVVELTTNT